MLIVAAAAPGAMRLTTDPARLLLLAGHGGPNFNQPGGLGR